MTLRTDLIFPRRVAMIALALSVPAVACSRHARVTDASPAVAERPPARSGFGLAFDTRRSRLVLFGGSDTAFERLGDTWEWSAAHWTRVAVNGPPARSDFAMTFDARRGRVVMFGGRTATGAANDTWEFDGTRWLRVDSAGPGARALTSMAYDDARGRVVLFSGSAGSKRPADTWEWDGHAWTEMPVTTPGPVGRGAHAMVYDAAARRVVLIGGYDKSSLSDTWEWDGARWTRGADGPDILHTAAAFDPQSGRTLIFGGFNSDVRSDHLLARASSSWSTIATAGPPARAEHRGVYAPGVGFVIFGGIGGQGMSVAERGRAKLNDLWAFDAGQWRRLEP